MSAVVWGLFVLVVCPLLQFPVIVYLSRRMEPDEEPPPSLYGHAYPVGSDVADSTTADSGAANSGAATVDPDSTAIESDPPTPSDPYASSGTCPECGVDNDPAYRYCRGCATGLR